MRGEILNKIFVPSGEAARYLIMDFAQKKRDGSAPVIPCTSHPMRAHPIPCWRSPTNVGAGQQMRAQPAKTGAAQQMRARPSDMEARRIELLSENLSL